MIKTYNVLGLMSGSSLDGLDLAFATFRVEKDQISWQLHAAETLPYPQNWVVRLSKLTTQNALTFAKTHTYYGHFMGELVNNFINKHKIAPDFIAAHGHTIFHNPSERITTQIGDGAALAAITGLPVVNNFRTHDIAINGEGTPIAPAADKYLFPDFDFYLNIGGIANISFKKGAKIVAFDIAPANQVLNTLANKINLEYDQNGENAARGSRSEGLFSLLNSIPFFQKKYPKSLDNTWIQQVVAPIYFFEEGRIEDKLRTATEHLAFQTKLSIEQILKTEKIDRDRPFKLLVTGGGAFNGFLIEQMKIYCNQALDIEFIVPNADIIMFKEALLMGLMGVLRVENRPNVFASVTGAKHDTIGGAIWQGTKQFI